MAQQDATEQLKQVLRELIRFRFWISVGIAALLAVGAYFLGSGPVKAKAASETNAIKGALTEVQKYTSPKVPTEQYKPIVEEKTESATKDVNTAWKELYDRQAPLLTWPETVQERFRKWGRKWPEGEEPSRVQLAIVDYIYAYPAYVDLVYKTFRPFNYETGDGVVAAAPKEGLLRPAVFQVDHPPDMGKVWASQERLWVQRTLLKVVDEVNRRAKDWDSAIIKQIDRLEVGNPLAQDQRSLAKSEALEQAPGIYAPGQEPQAEDTGGGAGGADMMGGGMGGMMAAMMSGRKGREMAMSGYGGMGMGASTGAGTQYDESIYFITPPNEKSKEQYKILPVLMTVMIDQDHIQDFLVELENSPMAIQVMDFDLQRRTSSITKPEKGTQQAGFGMMGGGMMGYGGMYGSMMMRRMAEGGMGRGMAGYGGMMSQMMNQQYRGMGGYGGMGGMMGLNQQAQRKGTDVRGVNREKQREETKKAIEEAKGPSLFDPYYDIVEVTVYGQARFFNPPPEEPKPEPSASETAAQPEATPATAPGGAPAATEATAPNAPATPAAPAAGTGPEAKSEAAKAGAEAAQPATPPAGAPAPAAKSEPAANPTKGAAPKR
jgi:hypothetical protein